MIDGSGQVTASYAYGDYGQPIGANPALLPTPAASPAGNAAVNPFGYDGAYTNPATGTEYLPARTYDPGQGRFLSLDAADQINRYQAFATNPINNTDPTGQWAFPQILTDAFAAALFLACGVLSGAASVPVLAAVLAGEETAATAITASVVFNAFSAATNIGAAATSATLAANDAAELTGNGFLSDDSKKSSTRPTPSSAPSPRLPESAPVSPTPSRKRPPHSPPMHPPGRQPAPRRPRRTTCLKPTRIAWTLGWPSCRGSTVSWRR